MAVLVLIGSRLPPPAPSVSTASSTPSATSSIAAATALATSTAPEAPPTGADSAESAPPNAAQQALTASGANLLKAVVNILCVPNGESGLRGISGSGVIIDSRGLILTAAHIGQYFLLRDYRPDSIACVIRTGGPAEDAYQADAVYVSPSWVSDNPDTISENAPTGTGEDDFAILAITGSATKTPLPASFPSVPLAPASSANPAVGENVAIGAYAAQYLGTKQIENDLYPTIVFNAITDRFTFGVNTVDVISITGTPAAQEGSSGGGIADASGYLIGEITTSSVTGDVSTHTLNAITPRHLRASFLADTGEDLDSYLASHSPADLVSAFASTAQKLGRFLTNANR